MMYHQRSEDSGYVTVEIQKPIADFEKKDRARIEPL
jgi:hypothetical protein